MALVSAVAPYGQDDLGCLRSVFEMPHLQRNAIFLDTQCESHAFNLHRRTITCRNRSHAGPHWTLYISQSLWRQTAHSTCCHCALVLSVQGCAQWQGREGGRQLRCKSPQDRAMPSSTHSTLQNQQEVIAVMAIARLYHKTGKAYRIITRAFVDWR